jgi:hypothetical protein
MQNAQLQKAPASTKAGASGWAVNKRLQDTASRRQRLKEARKKMSKLLFAFLFNIVKWVWLSRCGSLWQFDFEIVFLIGNDLDIH